MCQVNLNYVIGNESQQELDSFVGKYFALGLYRQHHTSLGKCADIAGMTEEDFIIFLGENGESIFYYADKDEYRKELEDARNCC